MTKKSANCEKLLARLEKVIGASRIGVDIIDAKFNIRYIDPAWKKVYGDPSGKKCYEYFMGRKKICPRCGVMKALKTKKTAVTEERLVREGDRPVQVTTIPFRDEDGKWMVAETNVDISRLKNIEEHLRQSELRYRKLFEAAGEAIFMADLKTRRLVDCNKMAEKLLGYSRKKILTMKAYELHPKDKVKYTMRIFSEQAKGRSLIADTEIINKYGKKILVNISTTLFDLGGKKYLMGIFRDVSEKRRSEQALRLSEERYRTLAELSEDAIFIMDLKGIFTYMNSFTASFAGIDSAKAVGKSVAEVLGAEMDAAQKRDIKKIRKNGKAISSLVKVKNLWMDTHLSPVRDASGKIIAVMAVARNITPYKVVQEALESSRDNLEKIVKARSEALLRTSDELNKKKRLSDVGMLAATVAHELRSPLATMRTSSYNIRKKSRDHTITSHLDNIDKKVVEADRIVRNLLFYSNIKLPQYERVNICALIDDVIKASLEIYKSSGVSLKRIYENRGNIMAEADPFQMKEVFSNILHNAYESFGAGKGRIIVRALKDKSKYVRVLINDNGPGINIPDLNRLYEPFFTTKVKGIGLGLTVCDQIVNLHNGAIDIDSTLGKGTSVLVVLPSDRWQSKPNKEDHVSLARHLRYK